MFIPCTLFNVHDILEVITIKKKYTSNIFFVLKSKLFRLHFDLSSNVPRYVFFIIS